MKKQQLVSVICDLTHFEEKVRQSLVNLSNYLIENYYSCELIIIANGLEDNCYEQLKSVISKLPSIRLLKLNSRVNSDTSITAGLDNAIGDYVVLFDVFHDPVHIICDVVAENTKLSGFIIGVSDKGSESFLNKAANYIGKDIPKNATKLRCLSRHTINMLLKSGGYHHNVLYRLHKLGLTHRSYTYSPDNPLSASIDNIKYLIRNVVFGDPSLIRRAYLLGAVLSILISVIMVLISSSSITPLYMLVFLLFISVGGAIELLLRLIDLLSEKDRYIVVEEISTPLATNDKRLNVVDE